jgi:hypothetical protein
VRRAAGNRLISRLSLASSVGRCLGGVGIGVRRRRGGRWGCLGEGGRDGPRELGEGKGKGKGKGKRGEMEGGV